MNFNIVDLIARIEQLEANSINNTAIYELNKSISRVVERLDSAELVLGKTVNCDAFTNAMMDAKSDIAEIKKSITLLTTKQSSDKKELVDASIELAKTIKEPVEPLNYDSDIELLTKSIATTKDSLLSSIESVENKIKPPAEPLNYNSEIESLSKAIENVNACLSESISAVSDKIKPPIEPPNYNDKFEELEVANKALAAEVTKALTPIKDIEAKVESSRRTYGEELSSFTLKTNKKIDAINETLGANNGE